MITDGEKIQKRNIFIEADVQHLLDCVRKRSKTLANRKTNAKTTELKRKAWAEVLEEYNAGQIGGKRTLPELKNRYKNEKKLAKQRIAANARLAVIGLFNPNDSDSRGSTKRVNEVESDENEDVELMPLEPCTSATAQASLTTSQHSSKKMKMTIESEVLIDLKAENLRLDNENKKKVGGKLDLEKRKLELESRNLELEKRKLELEIQWLEKKLHPDPEEALLQNP